MINKKFRLPVLIGILGLCLIGLGVKYSPSANAKGNYYLGAAGKSGSFIVQAIEFDGSTDYGTRADFANNADSQYCVLSFWLKPFADGAQYNLVYGTDGIPFIYRAATNKVHINLYTAALGWGCGVNTSAIAAASGWTHVLMSCDLSVPEAHLYVNDISDKTESGVVNSTIDWTRASWLFGTGGGIYWKGDLAEWWRSNRAADYLDFSVEANRRKFITAGGKPVDLGLTGAEPTGNQPILYLSSRIGDAAASFFTNKGDGGDFTANGSVVIAATSPSD